MLVVNMIYGFKEYYICGCEVFYEWVYCLLVKVVDWYDYFYFCMF